MSFDNNSSFHLLLKHCKEYLTDDLCVYKLCCNVLDDDNNIRKWFVVMKKTAETKTNENRSDVFDKDHANFRANKLIVIEIMNVDNPSIKKDFIINKYDTIETKYEVGKDIIPDKYDDDIKNVCSNGIHYFKTPITAYYHRSVPYNYTGHWIEWYMDGQRYEDGEYENRMKIKKWTKWCDLKKTYLDIVHTL
jgi:hypothetical protein